MLTTFAVYVDDAPGVLNRVASLFRRRAFNIVSLTVGHTEKTGVSRMTLVVDADIPPERIAANLYKLIDVQRVEVLAPRTSVERDLAMIKVSTSPVSRGEIMQLVQVFRARVVDVAPDSLIVEITGGEDKVDGLARGAPPVRHSRDGPHRPRRHGARRCRGDGRESADDRRDSSEASDRQDNISYSV